MKFYCNFSVLLSFAACAGCASLSARDELCGEIARFANSTAGQERSVQLTTDWGGVFSTQEDVIAEKTCVHDGFEPSKRLCSYLMENTSTEFADINVNRALRCMDAPAIQNSRQLEVQRAVRIESERVRGVKKGIVASVEYAYGDEKKPPSLKISAR